MRGASLGAFAAVALLALGCSPYRGAAHAVAANELQADGGWGRVPLVPPVYQRGTKDCGAAALSAVLRYWRESDASDLHRIDAALRESPAEGLRAGALSDYARDHGFHSFVFEGEIADLRHEIREGRPVIVGVHQELSSREFLAHYQVVVGFHEKRGLVLVFDPARGMLENPVGTFEQEWERAGRLTLVVAP